MDILIIEARYHPAVSDALVDGATIWQAFRHIAMPLARPGITVAMMRPVVITPGAMQFTVIPNGPRSCARYRV